MAKASEVFKKIRFAKLDPHHDKGPKTSTDDEEHGAVSEIEWDQQLKHVKKRAMQEKVDAPTGELKDACWKGYTAVGMKMKNGKKVPNCVPTNEEQKPPFDGPYKKSTGTVTDKSGAKHTPMSRARNLARDALKKVSGQMQKKKLEESRKADIVREAMKAGKKKKETKASDDTFQSEPELSSQIIRND